MRNKEDHLQSHILSTKLMIPERSDEVLIRRRLLDSISKGQHRKLTLISAPAGFGKTTLASQWAEQGESQFAWIKLDENDNNLQGFYSYLISAFRLLDPQIINDEIAKLPVPENFTIDLALTNLINSISNYSRPIALILDDYHVIREETIHAAITFLLNHLPRNLHIILVTRTDPPLPLALLRSRMQLNELRAQDLRFTKEETHELLSNLLQSEISSALVNNLYIRTEGWISGLLLVLMSLEDQDNSHVNTDQFDATQGFIAEYLINEVLDKQPDAVRKFMIQTSILSLLNASLCNAVADTTESESILQELYQNNVFLVLVDRESATYRYHPLFSDVLTNCLKQKNGGLEPELHRRASIWYENHNQFNPAIEHALAGKDFERASALIQNIASQAFLRGENDALLNWLKELPEDILSNNLTLSVYRALGELSYGYPEQKIKERLKEISGVYGQKPLPGEIWGIRALLAANSGNTTQSLEYCLRAVELLPQEKDFLRGYLIGNLGRAHMENGDVKSAMETLKVAMHISQKAGDQLNLLMLNNWLGDTCFLEGKLNNSKSYYEQALKIGAQTNGLQPPNLGRVMSSLGRLYLEQNELEKAEQNLEAAIQLSSQLGNWSVVHAKLGMVQLNILRKRFKEAEKMLTGMSEVFSSGKYSDIKTSPIELAHCQLWIAMDKPERTSAWMNLCEEKLMRQRGSQLSSMEAQAKLTLAQLKISGARKLESVLTKDVLILLNSIFRDANSAGWRIIAREALVYLAIAFDLIGDQKKSLRYLRHVLKLSAQEKHYKIFLKEGQALHGLLNKALESGYSPKFTSNLLMEIENNKLPARIETSPNISQNEEYIHPLSNRENEVLHLIEDGCSNKEIAEKLSISLSTVKAHLYNIYGKLDVHSRTQAIAKAHAKGILEADSAL